MPPKRPTATVFQDYALFPHMTVAKNVAFGLRMRGVAAAEQKAKAQAALELVGLGAHGARRPHELSGGQRQRVALARALVIEPKALLLDEPLGALDLALRRQMQDELKATQKRVGAAFIHVTHDQEEAMALADQVVVMNAGRIEDCGPPERVYARPATRFAATFMGESTLIEGKVAATYDERSLVETTLGRFDVAGAAHMGDTVALALRPEAVRVGPARGDQGEVALGKAAIGEITFQGAFKRVAARTAGDHALLVKCPAATALTMGEAVELSARTEDLILLTR